MFAHAGAAHRTQASAAGQNRVPAFSSNTVQVQGASPGGARCGTHRGGPGAVRAMRHSTNMQKQNMQHCDSLLQNSISFITMPAANKQQAASGWSLTLCKKPHAVGKGSQCRGSSTCRHAAPPCDGPAELTQRTHPGFNRSRSHACTAMHTAIHIHTTCTHPGREATPPCQLTGRAPSAETGPQGGTPRQTPSRNLTQPRAAHSLRTPQTLCPTHRTAGDPAHTVVCGDRQKLCQPQAQRTSNAKHIERKHQQQGQSHSKQRGCSSSQAG